MLTTTGGIVSLRKLRMNLEADAGDEFPAAVSNELFMLYDVCVSMDLNVFQCEDVLGDAGWQFVKDYLNLPVYPTETGKQQVAG